MLFRNLLPTRALAIPLMALSAAITGTLLYFGIGHPSGFPWIAALLTGTLLAATDPVAVLDLFKRAGAPMRLRVLVDGESLFNDATAIVLFTLLLGMALDPTEATTWSGALGEFALTFFGGLLAGAVVGAAVALAIREAGPLVCAALSVISAYAAFLVAEEALHVMETRPRTAPRRCACWRSISFPAPAARPI